MRRWLVAIGVSTAVVGIVLVASLVGGRTHSATSLGGSVQAAATAPASSAPSEAPPGQPVTANPAYQNALPQNSSVPADATMVWGPNTYAAPADSNAKPLVSVDAAEKVFQTNAFNGKDRDMSTVNPHLWTFTNKTDGIFGRLSWVLVFQGVTENNPSSHATAGSYAGCTESYVVDATTAAGLYDITTCPKT
jgi:hypothetical protein